MAPKIDACMSVSNAPSERPWEFDRKSLECLVSKMDGKLRPMMEKAVEESKRDKIDVLDTFWFDKASRSLESRGYPQEMVMDVLRKTYKLGSR